MSRNAVWIACAVLVLAWSGVCPAGQPDWLERPEESRWIVFGGETGVSETNGLSMRSLTSGEGNLEPAERDGVACARSVREDGKMGYFYLNTDPADMIRAWLGDENEVLLTVRYFDGSKGSFRVSYDSSDERVKKPPYAAGVWRRPDHYPMGVELAGDGKWKTVRMRLELAHFAKRQHSSDIRIGPGCSDFALAGVAITPVLKQEIARMIVRQALRLAKGDAMDVLGGAARFSGRFVQRADEPIVMAAAAATTLGLQEGKEPGVDPDAWSGSYIHFVDSATWRFTVETPGRYVMWQRASFPWGGNWNHDEDMDGQGRNVSDGRPKGAEGWQWVRAGAYELAAGEHAFHLSYHAGARLDVLVLSLEDVAPDGAGLRSSCVGAFAGVARTVPVRPLDVAEWRRVSFAASCDAVKYSVSGDDGRTWQPFDPGQPLSELTMAGTRPDALAFQVELAAEEGRPPPVLSAGVLEYRAGPGNVRVVENDRVRIEFDPVGVKHIFDKKAGAVVSEAASLHGALAMVTVKAPGPSPVSSYDLYSATLGDVEITGDAKSPVLTMSHILENGMTLVTGVRLLPDGQSEWRLTVDNPTGLEVAELRFPVITGIKLGGREDDDWMFMAKCWGQVRQHPAQSGRLSTTWGTSMRWTAMWDERQGFYLGIEDSRRDDYGFVYGGDGSGGTTLAPCQRVLVKPNSTWTSAVYRVALTGPDWHEAADVYRDYVARDLAVPDVHPAVKWLVDRWTTQNSNAAQVSGWDMIGAGGPALMAANRQMLDGADSCYCGLFPYPSPAWGSIREFSQKLGVRRALGGMYTPYHNFHLWSPGYGHYKRVGSFPKTRLPDDIPVPDDAWYAKAAVYSYDGAYPRLEEDPFAQLGMAMGSAEWRDWLAYWTDRYLEWGADGMYYDQFNMIYGNGRLYPDFDTYGCWMPATLEVISRIRKAARAVNPYYTASAEVCNDVYGQFIDLHMTSGVFNRLEFFTYCNPRQILIDGGWNGGLGKAFGGQERVRFIWQVGARGEGCFDERQLALRRAAKSILYDADFMDTVGLTVHDARGKVLEPEYSDSHARHAPFRGVIGRWFLFRDGDQRGAVVNLINYPPQRGAKATLDTKDFGPVTAAMAWTLEGKAFPVEGVQKDSVYTFPVPEAELSSVVLSGGMRPVVEWDLEPAAAAGERQVFTVKLTNVNAEPMSGTASLRLPRGWRAPADAPFGPVPPGGGLAFALPFTVPDKASRERHDVWCDVRANTGDFSAYGLLVVNEPVIGDFRGAPGGYHVWVRNLGTEPLRGKLNVRMPAGLNAEYEPEFALPPRSTLELPVQVRGQDGLREISEMAADVTFGRKLRLELLRGLIPPVPNGDFETDSAGDMKPDWWMCRKGREQWSYERMHLDTGARGGRFCLRLDPPEEGEQFVCAYPVHSAMKPRTRYRVSVWIKAAKGDGVYANVLGRRLGKGETDSDWKEFESEAVTGPRGSCLNRVLYNYSDQPAYFDDLRIVELDGQ